MPLMQPAGYSDIRYGLETTMNRKYGICIVLGLVIGAVSGIFMGQASGDVALAIALGALRGAFAGWFVAVIVARKGERASDRDDTPGRPA